MAKQGQSGEVNKSAAIRELLQHNPDVKASEAIATLGKQGIKVAPTLYYFVKGKMSGRKGRRKKARQMVEHVTATMSSNGSLPIKTSDVVSTILKVKHLAADVGGLKKLKNLVDALIE